MNDWIPVGEKLPKHAGWYEVTEVLDTVTPKRITAQLYYSPLSGWTLTDQRSTVVAWKCLSRPYMGDAQGQVDYGQVTWHVELTAGEVAVLDMIADLMQAASANLDVGMSPSQRSVYNKIKDMAQVSKTYPSKEKVEGDWVVRDKEPL